jgi:uncharacterized XkdX family phage protein
MSRLYNTVKRYYDKGYYSEADVATFVRAGKITPDEYELITGEPYEADALELNKSADQ